MGLRGPAPSLQARQAAPQTAVHKEGRRHFKPGDNANSAEGSPAAEDEHAAAVCIQKYYRGYIARYHFACALFALSGKPSLQRAREYKRLMQRVRTEIRIPCTCAKHCIGR